MTLKFNYKSTYKIQKDYLTFHIFKRKKMFLKPLIITIALLACLIIGIIQKNMVYIGCAVALILVINGFNYLLIYKIYKQNLKDKKYDNSEQLIITMELDKFTVENLTTEEEIDLEYTNVRHIYNTKNYIYIYLNNIQAICIDKAGLTQGNIEEFFKEYLKKRIVDKGTKENDN